MAETPNTRDPTPRRPGSDFWAASNPFGQYTLIGTAHRRRRRLSLAAIAATIATRLSLPPSPPPLPPPPLPPTLTTHIFFLEPPGLRDRPTQAPGTSPGGAHHRPKTPPHLGHTSGITRANAFPTWGDRSDPPVPGLLYRVHREADPECAAPWLPPKHEHVAASPCHRLYCRRQCTAGRVALCESAVRALTEMPLLRGR